MAKSKPRKIAKRLRKGAGRVLGNRMVQEVLEDLISAALIAAAVKLHGSRTVKRAAEAARKKAGSVAGAAGQAVAAKGPGKSKRARKGS